MEIVKKSLWGSDDAMVIKIKWLNVHLFISDHFVAFFSISLCPLLSSSILSAPFATCCIFMQIQTPFHDNDDDHANDVVVNCIVF